MRNYLNIHQIQNTFAFVPVTTTSRNATRGLGGEARQLNPICVEMVIQVI